MINEPSEVFRASSSTCPWLVVRTGSGRQGFVDEDSGEVLVVLEPGDPLHLSKLGRYNTIREFAAGEPLRFSILHGLWEARIPVLRDKLRRLLGAGFSVPDSSWSWLVGEYG